jgi:hypothetical protein
VSNSPNPAPNDLPPSFAPPSFSPQQERRERNWLPLAVAAGAVLVAVAAMVFILPHRKPAPSVTPISAAQDPYASSLPITGLVMSESSNLAGGKVTYVDGHIANTGNRIVTGITVQVIFRSYMHEVAQNETHPLQLIRTRDPYVDLEPVSAAPLQPGATHDFRLIFDAVSQDWDGAYPELRVVRVNAR